MIWERIDLLVWTISPPLESPSLLEYSKLILGVRDLVLSASAGKYRCSAITNTGYNRGYPMKETSKTITEIERLKMGTGCDSDLVHIEPRWYDFRNPPLESPSLLEYL